MATQAFELFEHSKVTLAIAVVDANGDAVDLTSMVVHFYVHDLAEEADGTNLIELDSDGSQVAVTGDATDGNVLVDLLPADLVITETVQSHVEGIWQVRYENSAGDDDVDLLTLPQPFIVRRNRAQSG